MSGSSNTNSHQQLFQSWVKDYASLLLGYTQRRVNVREAAEDLVQETFAAAWQGVADFRAESSVKSWLFAILDNKIRDYYRKQLRNPLAQVSALESFDADGNWLPDARPQAWNSSGQLLDSADFQAVLTDCMQALSPTANASIQAKYLDEKSGEDICQDLGITTTTYWQILHRARLQLRKCLEHHWFRKDNDE